MRLSPLSSCLALAALIAPPCSAQYTVKRLVFQGGQPYAQPGLESASGLKTGQKIGQKEMSEAAQRIMDTGAFSDIEVTVNGPVSGTDVIVKLKPADPASMLPVSFENIVWLTPEEREASLAQRVPLYRDKLPAAGSLQTSVQAALQAMLTARGITATVELLQKPSTATRPTVAIAYRVSQPQVVVSNVKLAGVTAELAPAERKAIQSLIGSSFNEGIDAHLADTLLTAYRNAGYLNATLQGLTRTPEDDGHGTTKVTLAAQVIAGEAFTVSSVSWAGTPIYSAEDFARTSRLHPGDPASSAALRDSYQPILDAYLKLGYVDAVIMPQVTANSATHTADFTLSLTPGPVYHVGTVTVKGLSAPAQKEFDAAWRLKSGAVFDSIYAMNFLQLNTALRTLQPYTGKVDTVAHPETHTVDVKLTFFANNR